MTVDREKVLIDCLEDLQFRTALLLVALKIKKDADGDPINMAKLYTELNDSHEKMLRKSSYVDELFK